MTETLPGTRAIPKNGTRLIILLGVVACADFVFGATFVAQMLAAGLRPAVASTAISIAGLVSLAVELPSGVLGDKYGHKKLTVAGLLAWGVGQSAFGLSSVWWSFGLSLLLWGIGMSLFSGAPAALVINELKASGREGLLPKLIARVHVTHWVASAVGAGSVFVWGGLVSGGTLIAVSGGVLALLGGWVFVRWPEGRAQSQKTLGATLREGLRATWLNARLPVAYGLMIGLLQGVLLLSWQPLVSMSVGGGERVLGLVLLGLSLSAALGAWGAERLAGVGRSAVSLGAVCFVASGLWLSTLGVPALYIGLGIAEVGLGAGLAVTAIWQHEVFNDEFRNTQVSAASALAGVGVASAQAVFGWGWESVGLELSIVIAGVVVAALTLGMQCQVSVLRTIRLHARKG